MGSKVNSFVCLCNFGNFELLTFRIWPIEQALLNDFAGNVLELIYDKCIASKMSSVLVACSKLE